MIATGRVTTYPDKSKYQIVIDDLEPAGIGALMALLEERKTKLAAEGLFDAAAQEAAAFLPRIIGVVTSPTGAVIRDMLQGSPTASPATCWSGRCGCRARPAPSRSPPPSTASTG